MRNDMNSAMGGRGKVRDAQEAFAELLAEATRRGYFGTVSLTLHVQDGFVQQVRVATERLVK
jgi:hypothetical protein